MLFYIVGVKKKALQGWIQEVNETIGTDIILLDESVIP